MCVKRTPKIVGSAAFQGIRLGEESNVLNKAEGVGGAPPSVRIGFDRRGFFVEAADGRVLIQAWFFLYN